MSGGSDDTIIIFMNYRSFASAAAIAWSLATASAQYSGWQHSGSLYILTTPEGANLPSTSEVKEFPLLVLLDKKTFDFPNASSVLVFLCISDETVSDDPLAVAVFDVNDRLTDVYLRTPYPIHPACPLPAVSGSN